MKGPILSDFFDADGEQFHHREDRFVNHVDEVINSRGEEVERNDRDNRSR